MDRVNDRSDRFEMIAVCDGSVLEDMADSVLETEPSVRVLQEPRPQLVMQQITEPVMKRDVNLGEVLVTAAEVEMNNERGFAMVGGKDEVAALSGAIVDAAIEGKHSSTPELSEELRSAAAAADAERRKQWAESQETKVEFRSMEGEL